MVRSIKDITWGGSGIEKVVFDFITERIPVGSMVVEIGAGLVSTAALSLFYNLYSVEHDIRYANKVDGVQYIHAPKVNDWYDVEVIKKDLPIEDQKLVLVDGLNRHLILNHMDLFNPSALYIVHDTYRAEEQRLAIELSYILKRPVTFYNQGDFWASI